MTHPHETPFGSDRFGVLAERFARFFGTPKFIIVQTAIVILWIAANVAWVAGSFDPYPFILLNLMFSTQAAYAAPLILLAQTRQADRDKATAESDAKHREQLSERELKILRSQDKILAAIHEAVTAKETHGQVDPSPRRRRRADDRE